MDQLKGLEGNTSASELKEEIEKLIQARNLNLCLECGKCSAVCPMLDFYGGYVYDRSPRGVVERLLFDPQNIYDESLWYCLTCQECTALCPAGIDFEGFMTDLRELLLRHGHRKYALFCPVCGSYLMPRKEFEKFQKILVGGKTAELLSVCPQCKKSHYVGALHRLACSPKISGK